MNKIQIIAFREFSTRVRKKSFLIMTLLGPLLFGLVMIVPWWLKAPGGDSTDKKTVLLLDEGKIFSGKNLPNEKFQFEHIHASFENAKVEYIIGDYLALLHFPEPLKNHNQEIDIYTKEKLSLREKYELEKLVNDVALKIRIHQFAQLQNANDSVVNSVFLLNNKSIFPNFEQPKHNTILSGVSLLMAVLIYIFILFYGSQVMRGVMEEKSNRIIEVIISSVKPFQLMMGKILGVGMVSLLQFGIWISLTAFISTFITARFSKGAELFNDQNIGTTLQQTNDVSQSLEMNEMVTAFSQANFLSIAILFIYFFVIGYLVYSALFAAIGAAADSDTDVQQFMLPVTVPLFFCFLVISSILENPHSTMAVVLSIFPLTSPIIMMARIPFGVPLVQIIISMIVLFSSLIGVAWAAAKVYRVGILMYGKKVGYKELGKWLFEKR